MKQKISMTRQNANAKLKLLETFGDTSFDRHYFAEICDNPLTGAFKKKTVVHAGLGGTPVPQEKTAEAWHTLSKTLRRDKTSAYLHIPFCSTHCLYCGFFANPAKKENMQAYAKALIRELEADQDLELVQSHPVNAVYLGGANRFSIGVQTVDTDIRTGLGRVADRQTVIDRLLRFKQTNHAAIIIDLIFGLPDQTMEIWEKDIDTLLGLELDGVDLYQLIRFPGGSLGKAVRSGRFKTLADQTQRALMFENGVKRMNRARYQRLSISHWGRKFRERNRYNLAMKEKSDCLAYGSGAGGSMDGHMVFLDGNLRTYLETAGKTKPVTRIMAPSAHHPHDFRQSGIGIYGPAGCRQPTESGP